MMCVLCVFFKTFFTDTSQDSVPNAPSKATDVEGMIKQLGSELSARCEAFETAITKRLDMMESSFNQKLEKMDASIAGLILTGEHITDV